MLADWASSGESQTFLAKYFRDPLASKHPYLPDDTEVVTYGLTGKEVVGKVLTYWDRCIAQVN